MLSLKREKQIAHLNALEPFAFITMIIITSCKNFDKTAEDFDIIVDTTISGQQLIAKIFYPVD